ncbi:hypothetical protein L0222_12605 [bacterium]|nr:hypothetical protein [bacterium]MCI0607003.1 hypothetical protein [bacterium]
MLVSCILVFLAALLLISTYLIPFWIPSNVHSAKAIQFIRLGSLILVFDAITFYFRNRTSSKSIRQLFFPFIIAISSVLLLIGYRWIIGAKLGLFDLPTASESLPSGALYNAEDIYGYAAWIIQAKQGHFMLSDLYTVEPHGRYYFNIFFLAVGTIARWFSIPSITALFLFGIAGTVILLITIFYAALRFGMPEGAAKWSCILAAFSSGMSGTINLIGQVAGVKTPPGADLRYQDAILFSTFYAYPYHSVSFALLSIVVLLIASYDNRELSGEKRFLPVFLLSVAVLFMNFTHPYESILLTGAYGVYYALYLLRNNKTSSDTRSWILLVLASITVPATIYHWWVSQHPVWDEFAKTTFSWQANRLFWLLGYGLSLPASFIGLWICFKHPEYKRIRWMGVFPLMLFLLLVVFNIKQTKISSGGHFYLCILAGLAVYLIKEKILRITRIPVRRICCLLGTVVLSLFFINSILLLFFIYSSLEYETELLKAVKTIRHNSSQAHPLVLSDVQAGVILPGLGGVRVYSGHLSMTPHYLIEKTPNLVRAGFEYPHKGMSEKAQFEHFTKLFVSAKFEFVLVEKNMPAFAFSRRVKQLQILECYKRRCLFSTPGTGSKDSANGEYYNGAVTTLP